MDAVPQWRLRKRQSWAKSDRPKDPKKVAAGQKGGRTTVAKHGLEHMRQIGRAGYDATVVRHFGGDEAAANRWLTRFGLAVQDWDVTYGRVFKFPGPHPAHNVEEEVF